MDERKSSKNIKYEIVKGLPLPRLIPPEKYQFAGNIINIKLFLTFRQVLY